jgi:hypothetical protein
MHVTLERFFISPGHNFFGRRSLPAGTHLTAEPTTIRCRAGWGIEGDRFYGYRPDYNGQITFFSAETLAALRERFALSTLSAGVLRRNVLLGGVDLATLIGRTFTLGGVSFAGTSEARPCHWMNHAVAPGAEEWLKGRGGLRADPHRWRTRARRDGADVSRENFAARSRRSLHPRTHHRAALRRRRLGRV